MPQDAEHIKFINIRDVCKKELKAQNEKKNYFCDLPDYVPYEFFEPSRKSTTDTLISNEENKVLVLWLNNDTFAHYPNILEALYELEKQIQPDSKTVKLNIIGPSDSHTLRQLYKEKSSLTRPNKYFQNNLIFSPFATADYDQLSNIKGEWESKSTEHSLQNKIIRTIGTDNSLAETLLCEMALRGITPYQIKSIKLIEEFKREKCHGLEGLKLTEANQPHHIVLIGELDTFYSRMLTESIVKKIDEFNQPSDSNITVTHVHRFNYLRGLDGIISKSTPANQDNKNKDSQTNKLDSKEAKEQAERPTGTSDRNQPTGLPTPSG